MKKIYYFAYGSNLLQDRLEFRVGQVISVRYYELQDYKLVFNCGGYANIIPCIGESVEGWLYELTAIQLGLLDRYEGFYYKEFFNLPNDILGVVYIGMPDAIERNMYARTTLEYFNIVLAGMIEKELINSYNKLIAQKEEIIVIRKINKPKRIKSVYGKKRRR